MDNGEYGVVLMRGHGGDLGGDFGSAYWADKAFPATLFFLESCHGADPGALPGMPTWTINRGASVWLGWNESVSFNCGDNGTDLFFQKIKEQKSVGEAVAAVHATGCRPPELIAFPTNKDRCQLAIWKSDPNEAAVTNVRDFKLLRLVSSGTNLYATISFYSAPVFDEFFFYVDTGGSTVAEVLVKCRPTSFEVYKQTQPGLYVNKVYTGTPSTSGNDYSFVVPWNTSFSTAGHGSRQ